MNAVRTKALSTKKYFCTIAGAGCEKNSTSRNFLQKNNFSRRLEFFFAQKLVLKNNLFSREEVRELGLSDLEAISNWLGSKPYMMGNAPHQVDCSVFGFLATLFYNFPEDYYLRKETESRFPNLKTYVERIKTNYWPDWDELLSK